MRLLNTYIEALRIYIYICVCVHIYFSEKIDIDMIRRPKSHLRAKLPLRGYSH